MPNKDFHLNHFPYNPTSDCLIAPQNNAVPIGTQPGVIGLSLWEREKNEMVEKSKILPLYFTLQKKHLIVDL